MTNLLFVTGKPGSGKSTFIGLLQCEVQQTLNRNVQIFNDREVLLSFAREGLCPNLIQLTDTDNFAVLNENVFDLATRVLVENLAATHLPQDTLAVVELSRQNYISTFSIVESIVGQHEFIIYLSVPLEMCIERNSQRESHTVPESELRGYFGKDDIERLRQEKGKRVLLLRNNSTMELLRAHAAKVVTLLESDKIN